MDLNLIPYPLSSQSLHAIVGGLIEDGGVVPDGKAVRIVGERYTRTKIIYEEALRADREGRISPSEYERNTRGSSKEIALYRAIRAYAGVEPYQKLVDRTNAEMDAIVDRVYP